MKLLALTAVLALTACAVPVPVKQPFPEVPAALLQHCPDLLIIDDDKNSMQDMLKIVIQNYSLYYQCAEKTHGWQDWYSKQKRIHESIK